VIKFERVGDERPNGNINTTGLDNSVQRYLKYQKDDAQIQNADA